MGKKKIIVLAFSLLSFISLVMYAHALSDVTLIIESDNEQYERVNGSVTPNQVTYTLSIDTDKEYNSIESYLEYDSEKLEYVSCTTNQTLNNVSFFMDCGQTERSNIVSLGGIASRGFASGKTVFGTVTFKIKDTASNDIKVNFFSDNEYTTSISNLDTDTYYESNLGEKIIKVNVPVSNVELVTSNLEIDLGNSKTEEIIINYSPVDTTDSVNLSYNISNDVISIKNSKVENGQIKLEVEALKTGNSDVTINAFGRVFTSHINVIRHINNISLNESEKTLDLNSNEQFTFIATISPIDTTDDTNITWKSTNEEVASVENGIVTPLSIGTTTIEAYTSNNLKASATVRVVAKAKSVKINESDFVLDITDSEANPTKQLTITTDPLVTSDEVIWESSDDGVVRVDENGLVTAINGGSSTITVKVGEVSAKVNVQVNVKVSKIEIENIDENTITLYEDQKMDLIAKISPENATNKDIVWKILDDNIATIDQNGTLIGVKKGETKLTLTVDGVVLTVNVKVLAKIEGFSVDVLNKTLDANINETVVLTTTITPIDADENKTIKWTTSDESVAKVESVSDTSSLVTALSPGVAVITGTLENGKTVQTTITVVAPILDVTLDKTEVTLTGIDSSVTLNAIINPSNTTDDKTLTWTSLNESVVKVENGVLTAVGKGKTEVTVTTTNGKTATCIVTVVVPATGIKINKSDFEMEVGSADVLTTTITPEGASESTVIWTSSNPSVLFVTSNGELIAKETGTAKITASINGISDTITVKVIRSIKSFTLLTEENLTLLKHTTSKILTQINPSNTTEDTTITWKSSNPFIALVDSNGIITAKNKGTAKITGTLKNGKSVTVNVTVTIIPITKLEAKEENVELLINSKTILDLLYTPVDTTEKDNIKWVSLDENIVSVDENGIITGNNIGSTQVIASIDGISATFNVTVKGIPLKGLKVTNKNVVDVGDTFKLNVVKDPTDSTSELSLSFESSDESIALVDENGVVKALSKGEVTITITNIDGIKVEFLLKVNEIKAPYTSDKIIYSIISLISSIVLIIVLFIYKKFKKNN